MSTPTSFGPTTYRIVKPRPEETRIGGQRVPAGATTVTLTLSAAEYDLMTGVIEAIAEETAAAPPAAPDRRRGKSTDEPA